MTENSAEHATEFPALTKYVKAVSSAIVMCIRSPIII